MRAEWFDRISELLDPETYLQQIFRADERVEAARAEVVATEEGHACQETFSSVDAARAWLERVRAWRQNLRAALIADCVPASKFPLR